MNLFMKASLIHNKNLQGTLGAFVCLSLTLGLVFFPVVKGEKILFPGDLLNTMILPYAQGQPTRVYNHFLNDVVVQYLPYKKLTQNALQAGQGAYWNPLILGGFPQYALTMAGNFDVTNIVYLMGFPVERAYLLQILALLLIAGLSMFALLRYYGLLWEAAFLGALSYMLNSMFITTAFFPWILGPFCWMPLVILWLDRSLRQGGGGDIAACGLFLGIAMLASSVQTMSFLVFLTFIYTALWWRVAEKPHRQGWRPLKLFVMIHALAAGTAAVMLLPTLELFYYDALRNGQWAQVGQGPVPFIQRLWGVVGLISFVFPQLAGNVRAFDLTKLASSTMMFYTGFIGFLPLVFGVFSSRSIRQDRRIMIYWGIAFLGIAIPLLTPLLKYVYHRFFIIYIFAMSVLSAFGLSFYLRQKDCGTLRPFLRKFFIVFLCMVVALGIVNYMLLTRHDQMYARAMDYVKSHMHMANLLAGNRLWYLARVEKMLDHFRFSSPQMLLPILTMACGLALLWAYGRNRLRNPAFITGIFILNVLQLGFFARDWLPMMDPEKDPLYPPTASAHFLKKDQDIYRILIYNININQKPVYSPNILSMYGIETINGYESVEPRTVRSLARGADPQALGLCNVKYVLTHADTPLNDTHFHLAWEGNEGIKIYRNDLFVPRASLRYDYAVVPEGEFLRGFYDGRFDPGEKVFFSREPGGRFQIERTRDIPAPPAIVPERYAPEEIIYRVRSPKAGYLVVSNTWYPGWSCYVDGQREKLLKANECMWAVNVPAGDHKVCFVFRPLIFKSGMVISMVFLAFIFAVMGKTRYA
ncbi:MAG: YfhO family protein [Candidatus Omnitrophota bacterium]|jgi:hypothetical protein